jgi:hypothetical protein
MTNIITSQMFEDWLPIYSFNALIPATFQEKQKKVTLKLTHLNNLKAGVKIKYPRNILYYLHLHHHQTECDTS